MVAERWGCTPNHVRNLIKRGELRAFRLGERLLRIPAEALDGFEQKSLVEPPPAPTLSPSEQNTFILTMAPSASRKREKGP